MFVWIKTQKEFMHKYEKAPDEVSFLKNEHRHIFHFKVYLEVFNNERDVEFIMFKTFINKVLDTFPKTLGNMSCEMLSDELNKQIFIKYPNRNVKIEVSEDNENGCEKTYTYFK